MLSVCRVSLTVQTDSVNTRQEVRVASKLSGESMAEQCLPNELISRRSNLKMERMFISLTKWVNPATKRDSVRLVLALRRPLPRKSIPEGEEHCLFADLFLYGCEHTCRRQLNTKSRLELYKNLSSWHRTGSV